MKNEESMEEREALLRESEMSQLDQSTIRSKLEVLLEYFTLTGIVRGI